jgi:hypothetical protein
MTQQPDIHAVCILNHHEAWAALRMIREALEQHCPPGTVPNSELARTRRWKIVSTTTRRQRRACRRHAVFTADRSQ